MFNDWKAEKAVAGLVTEAQELSDKLGTAKPHILDAHAAMARLWAARQAVEGTDLYAMASWKAPALKKFTSATQTRINALRKARTWDQADGLTIWLHSARALSEPRILAPVKEIWRQLAHAGPNADAMAEELLAEEGLSPDPGRAIPKGFA
ncbi:hypothetical protein [Stagnihabitans tardus]|uniref:Uncharacterized protein n=1 Tax=Stagnihabitans tardus TaxID=2699202 RepID=A0AAE4YAP0_9RHOB|nr:hypothetical protein [Stagnihabitans tardus]NBZ88187.1 hypothetical protein [Stagnihabitans tardus]